MQRNQLTFLSNDEVLNYNLKVGQCFQFQPRNDTN